MHSNIDLRDTGLHEVPRQYLGNLGRGTTTSNYNRGLMCPVDHLYIIDSLYCLNLDASTRILYINFVYNGNYTSSTNYTYDASNAHFLHDDYDGKLRSLSSMYLRYGATMAASTLETIVTKDAPLYIQPGSGIHGWTNTDDNDIMMTINYRDFF